MYYWKFFKIFLLLFLSQLYFSQDNFNSYAISRLSQDDGLSQGSNYFRYEDQKGFMWITGNDALNRFDGTNVKVYNLNYFFNHCPTLQQGYGFAEDGKNLYIGSTKGLYKYDYQQDRFFLINVFGKINKDKTTIPFAYKDGKIWCFNKNYQISTYNPKTKEINFVTEIPIKSINSVHVYEADGNLFYFRIPFFDKNNTIWCTGKNELTTYNVVTKKINFPIKDFGIKEDFTFYCSTYNPAKNVIYYGTNQGILTLDLNKKNYTHVSSIENISLKTTPIIAVGKNFMAVRLQNGLAFLDEDFKKIKVVEKNFERSYCYSFDKAGRLWLCDDGKGQIILNFKGNLLKNSNEIENDYTKEIRTVGVSNFAEFEDGDMLIQSKYIFNHQTQEYSAFSLNKTQNNYIDYIQFFNDRSRNGIWMTKYNFSNENFGMQFLKGKNVISDIISLKNQHLGKFQHLAIIYNKPMLSFSKGLFWVNILEKKIEKITELPDNNPFFINPISKNRFAVSYLNNDMVLAKIDDNGKVKFIKKILQNVQSFYLQEDLKNKKFWVGTNEGVFCLDENFNLLEKIDSNNGLAGTYIYGILLDDFGKIWCSHQHGLSSIDTHNFSIINYDRNDGIQDWDYNNRSFFKSSKGVLYFGGVNGYNFFKPPLQISSTYTPEIYFDEIMINNQLLKAEKGYNSIERLDLKNTENNILIKALIKDLENGHRQKLMYRIKNTDQKWKDILPKTPLTLSSLSPGKYEIEFGILNKYNNKIFGTKTILITISAPFYKTIWFWIIVSGLIFGGIFAFYGRWKFLRQKEYYRHQLDLETQRKKITADLHDDLGAALSSLQINSAIAQKLLEKDASQVKNILKKIEIQSQKISENIGDIIWSLKPGKEEFMSMSTRIKTFANEILGSTNINYQIKIDEHIDTEITNFTARKNMVLIAKEALNNAAKYSKANNIVVKIFKENDCYFLEIKDNGIGFNPEKITGNGIYNMKKRTLEMNGVFEINSEKGTSIKISIPEFRDIK